MRRVLFDENIPRRLRRDLVEYEVRTVQEEGWTGLKNGELLRLAHKTFAVLLTGDKRLPFQQNIATFQIGIVVIPVASMTPSNFRQLIPQIKSAIDRAQPGTVVVVAVG